MTFTVRLPAYLSDARRYDAELAAATHVEQLRALLDADSGARDITVDPGGHVYSSGAASDHLFLIKRGQVKTVMVTPQGKRCLLSIYMPGDILGETALLGGPRTESAVALRQTVVRQVPADRFLAAAAAAGLLGQLLRHLTARVREQQKIIVDMVTMESERRLAARLLDLAGSIGIRHGRTVQIDAHITHEDLAEMVGTTRSRVGYFLKRFREAGLVEPGQRSRLVVDAARLADYVHR